MMAESGAVWLDVTRLVSRTGRGPFTGIDKVEHAYLGGLLARDLQICGFARTATGFVLLDRTGLVGLRDRIEGRVPWGAPDLLAQASRRLSPERKRAEADLRRLAMATRLRLQLPRFLARHLTPGTRLLNVGHSNLSDRVLRAFKARGARVGVMVHDTIPLDLPDHHRPGMPESFWSRIGAVARHADQVICPSTASAEALLGHVTLSTKPEVVAPGVDLTRPDPAALAQRLTPEPPYFVVAGTIDARKNQALLLEYWGALGPNPPRLYLAGSRGWCPPDLLAMLGDSPVGVTELAGLGDGALAALVAGSAGLLHPSLAEGYGFTLLEAAALDVPVVAADLPVYRETLGDIGVYLPPADGYQWIQIVKTLAAKHREGGQKQARRPDLPTWDRHLNRVLSII